MVDPGAGMFFETSIFQGNIPKNIPIKTNKESKGFPTGKVFTMSDSCQVIFKRTRILLGV